MKTHLLALLALAVVGCGPSSDTKAPVASSSGGGKPPAADSGSDAAPASPELAAYLDKLPAELKGDAFEYYGLGNGKTMRLEIVREGSGSQSASRTVQPGKIEGGKATFVLHQEGELTTEGDITLSLEKDGIYAMSSSVNKLQPHSLEMPNGLTVGGGWKDHTEMVQMGKKIVLDNNLKIVGKERVATPGGTFDEALHVTSTGKGMYGADAVTLNTQHWYVRGVGPVKQIVEFVFKDGRKQSVTLQLADPKKAEPAGSAPPLDLSKPLGGGR